MWSKDNLKKKLNSLAKTINASISKYWNCHYRIIDLHGYE